MRTESDVRRTVLLFGFLAVCMVAQAQGGCKVRYQYDAGGNRIQREWYCWTGEEEEEQEHEEGMAPQTGSTKAAMLEANAMRLHPNPSDDFVNFQLRMPVENGQLEVLDAEGHTVLSDQFTGLTHRLSIAHLPAGTYFARISVGSEMLISPFSVSHH
ncbi:MAG: T9SS type A sorting domain-containing protein [Flavobacteriales bacterium]|nr:MAG: T9SS type A sorting domain-containing protein [Flavobacteriales bacterium]